MIRETLDKLAIVHEIIQKKLDKALYGDVRMLSEQAVKLQHKYWKLRNEKSDSSTNGS